MSRFSCKAMRAPATSPERSLRSPTVARAWAKSLWRSGSLGSSSAYCRRTVRLSSYLARRHGDIAGVEPGLADFFQLARIVLLPLVALGHLEADLEALRRACRRFRPLAFRRVGQGELVEHGDLHAEELLVAGRLGDGLAEGLAHLGEDLVADIAHSRDLDVAQTPRDVEHQRIGDVEIAPCGLLGLPGADAGHRGADREHGEQHGGGADQTLAQPRALAGCGDEAERGRAQLVGIALGDALGLGQRHAFGNQQVALLAALLPAAAQRLDVVADAEELGIGGDDLLGALPVLQHALMREPDRGVLLAAGGEQDAGIDQRLDQTLGGGVVSGLGERHGADRQGGGATRFAARRRRRRAGGAAGAGGQPPPCRAARWRARPPVDGAGEATQRVVGLEGEQRLRRRRSRAARTGNRGRIAAAAACRAGRHRGSGDRRGSRRSSGRSRRRAPRRSPARGRSRRSRWRREARDRRSRPWSSSPEGPAAFRKRS